MIDPQPSRSEGVSSGFSDPIHGAQGAFRVCLAALSRPGLPQPLNGPEDVPAGLFPTSAAILLTLADFETPVWLDEASRADAPIGDYVRFQTSAPLVEAADEAAFALIIDPRAMPLLSTFAQGDPLYPDRSTTLVVQVDGFSERGPAFSGPGIEDTIRFTAEPLPPGFEEQLNANHHQFPCGVDIIFATRTHIAGFPRSTRKSQSEAACTSR